jgi:hypothetical protein
MTGIQTRGRGRTTTNKIEQTKTQNKVALAQPQSTTQYQPRPASGQLDQSTQNQIQPTTSNIEQARTVRRAKTKPKLINKPKQINTQGLTPLGKFGLGIYNTGSDYANILNTDYEDKSILNQAIGHAFEGNWDKAGQVIQNNPYRFAGNLAVEVGSALIPLGVIAKVAKVSKYTNKALNTVKKVTPKKKIDGEEVRTLYRIVGEGADRGMWFSKVPKDFYHDKVYAGVSKNMDGKFYPTTGQAQIRSVDVPTSVYKQFRVANFMKTDMEPHKLSEFVVKHTPENSPSLPKEIIKQKNAELDESIGVRINSLGAYSPNNEWVLKHRWQKTEKVIATAGQKESFVKRIFDSSLSGDKYQNQITKIYKNKGYKSTSSTVNSPERFDNLSSFNKPFLRADDQIKLENKVPSALISTGVSTAKTVASGANSNNKKVNKNSGIFGGYGQFF